MYVYGIREKSTGHFFPRVTKQNALSTFPCVCDGREKKIHLFTTVKAGRNFFSLWRSRNSLPESEFEIVVFTLREASTKPILHHPHPAESTLHA